MSRPFARHIKPVFAVCALAAVLTYASLLVPGRAIALCSNVAVPVYCPVLAYGFPRPFLADNQGVSPVGSVGRNPLWLPVSEDDVLGRELGHSYLFWLLIALLCRILWRGWRRVSATTSAGP